MSRRIGTMTQQGSGLSTDVYDGFSWPAFLFGPFWYFAKGMPGLGLLILVLAIPTAGIAWIVSGFLANKQHREHVGARGYVLGQ
jgi:hypothetical protein